MIRLSLFPNVEELLFGWIDTSQRLIIPRLKFDKIKTLSITVPEQQENLLEILIDKFETLRHLNLNFDYNYEENAVNKALKEIIKLKDLIHLKIRTEFGLNDKRFFDSIKQLANNCQKLKSIECGFDIVSKDVSNLRQLLSPLKAFKGLKRMKLVFNLDIDYDSDDMETEDINSNFSFEAFKEFPNITHLSLRFNDYPTLNERVLKDIDIHLPKLQYLKMSDTFDTTPDGTTQMADTLSRLSRLETIKLKLKNEDVYQRIEEQISEKCRKIRTIDIKLREY